MVGHQPVDDTKYAGPSKTIEILGRGHAYGWIGSVAGLLGGGIFSAVFTQESGASSKKMSEAFKKFGFDVSGKSAIVAGGALIGWQAMHYLSLLVGMRIAVSQSGHGAEQFKRMSEKCDALSAQVSVLKEEKNVLLQEQAKEPSPLTTVATKDSEASLGVTSETPAQHHGAART